MTSTMPLAYPLRCQSWEGSVGLTARSKTRELKGLRGRRLYTGKFCSSIVDILRAYLTEVTTNHPAPYKKGLCAENISITCLRIRSGVTFPEVAVDQSRLNRFHILSLPVN
ncbi:hypothetical protein CIHG_00928 [Coccidioides immitis H538.4]|uniref:Uncharacterized protein n=1 Tax=Coccidioides immitis H538.4 TaxID=396776 RepID=A0A0J8RF09_COCIT|nr:hypothetical protein CIHG_00928 [Coccidioides immitis H538.4]